MASSWKANSTETKQADMGDEGLVNILREKTFNDELRTLVNKVTIDRNKLSPQASSTINVNTLLASLNEKDLIVNFHTLFYRAKNLENVADVNISFNPFLLDDHSIESLLDSLNEELYGLGIDEFAILSYNLVDKVYASIHNRIAHIDIKNIYISKKDQLYKKIAAATDGYVLMPEEISGDQYLQKKFISSEIDGLAYFFIMFKNMTRKIRSEINPNIHEIHLTNNPSSILMIPVFPGQSVPIQNLCKKMAMHFLLLEKEQLWDNQENMTFEKRIAVLEYLLSTVCEMDDYIGIIFTFKKNGYKEMYYINRYLKSKLYKYLPQESIIMSVAKNRIVVFVHQKLENTIYSLVKEYNKFLSNTELDVFTNKECANTGAIMRKFFRY